MIGIYKITSPSGKIYIGQSVCIERRLLSYQRHNCKGQIALYASFIKYGFSKHLFEVIEECEESNLNERERYWQDYYNVLQLGLNCRLTSAEGRSGKLSEGTKKKMSESNKKALLGCKRSKESVAKGLETKGVFKHTEESKRRMSEQRIGIPRTQEMKNNLSRAKKGTKYSEDRCRAISERQLGKVRGPYKKKLN